ncbi:MADF domain [Cinara cedri]|uniref:MADF domain n=1 Tax=Cinara cedri TaxID=506608 RepID=A0A5E4MSW3_9HEMI|nr:MADF domain [Cinara cedri]
MTEQLIELVRKYTFLYDISSKNYMNIDLKDETWKIIGKELNENEIKDTTGQANKKYQKWLWASQLQFLDKSLVPRQRTFNITTDFPLEIKTQELTFPSRITSPPMASASIFDVEQLDDPQLYTRTDPTLSAPKKIKTKD